VNRQFQVHLLPADDLPDAFFAGTVLDGEMTPVAVAAAPDRPEARRVPVFLVFDCLMICGNQCSVLRYDQRLELGREVLFRLSAFPNGDRASLAHPVALGAEQPYALPVALRPEVSRYTVNLGHIPFTCAVKPVFDLCGLLEYTRHCVPRLPFEADGFVLTHLSEPCYPFRMKPQAVFKWKPRNQVFSENTIDFIVTPMTAEEQQLIQQGRKVTAKQTPLWQLFSQHPKSRNHWRHSVDMATVESYRQGRGDHWLWTVLPNRQQVCFGPGLWALPAEAQASVQAVVQAGKPLCCECRWNYQLQSWEIVRVRHKDVNQWTTVVATLQNIVEDLQLQELVSAV
jgi:hypothetical protein